ncbi:Innexin shaking-B [Blattella germanica]|nr:Innexin shaking-B [Blattella germanica]
MIDLVKSLATLFKIRHMNIDGLVFKLHYRATVSLLSIFCLLMAARQYVGDPIDCIHTPDIPKDVLNTFCWIHSTFSIPNAFMKVTGVDVPYPGVDNSRSSPENRREHRYYQWVVFCLLLQVSCCCGYNVELYFICGHKVRLYSTRV